MAEIYTTLGDKDKAFHWLEVVYERPHAWFPWVRVEPAFRPVRSDPRFQYLLRRMNFPE